MEENVSVSKGVFVHKGDYKIGQKGKRYNSVGYTDERWYHAFTQTWTTIKEIAEEIRSNMVTQVMSNLITLIKNSKQNKISKSDDEIPTAILLTGVNIPDHCALFQSIIIQIKKVTPHIALIWSRDYNTAGQIIEEAIYQFTNNKDMEDVPQFKKSQCSMRALKDWNAEYCDQTDPLVIILPDFESFSADALHDFVLILSSYASDMKFILLFGVATSLHSVHRSLSYEVSSKLITQVFHTQTQVQTLTEIFNGIIISPKTSFRLTGKAFQLLMDIFLFYDFSVDNFLQNYKVCMIQHFYGNNVSSLCCSREDLSDRINNLTDEDITEIQRLPSVVKYFKSLPKDAKQMEDMHKDEFKVHLKKMLRTFHKYMRHFLTLLKCLHCLTAELPNQPLGKQLRELYTTAVTVGHITELQEYKDCLQMLSFQSKDELIEKMESMLEITENSGQSAIETIRVELVTRLDIIREASLEIACEPTEIISESEKLSRTQLKEKLLKMSQKHSRSPFKREQLDLINYLDRKVFSVHLVNPSLMPTNEIFCYSDANKCKHHIRGSLRAVMHSGLHDPQVYLQCDCCKLENDDAIPSTLPDLSIIYKLHLESRKLINMYDWLQAFRTIVEPNYDAENSGEVDPKIQARFTRAVAELQFLGFIKSSRVKTDHVRRLT